VEIGNLQSVKNIYKRLENIPELKTTALTGREELPQEASIATRKSIFCITTAASAPVCALASTQKADMHFERTL